MEKPVQLMNYASGIDPYSNNNVLGECIVINSTHIIETTEPKIGTFKRIWNSSKKRIELVCYSETITCIIPVV